MRIFQRRVGMAILMLALVIAPVYVLAQDNNTINVAGSGIVAKAFQALANAGGAGAALNITVNGTNSGLDQLCTGTVDVALANRPLNEIEGQQCAGSNVTFLELLIGYDATAFVASSENTYLDCLTPDNLNTLFAPSAAGQTTTWDQVNAKFTAKPISVVLPQVNSFAYAKLDENVAGDGFRADAQSAADDAAVLAAVAASPDTLGVVNLTSLLAAGENAGVKAIAFQNNTLNTCVSPNPDTLQDRSYPLSNRMFVYVNADALDKSGLSDLLNYAVSDAAGAILTQSGFVAPSAETYTRSRDILTAQTTGRVFSKDVTAFSVSPDVTGAVTVGGGAGLFSYISNVQQSISQLYQGLTLTVTMTGVPAGARELCNGNVQIMASYGELTPDQRANCDANSIVPVTFDIGTEAAVLVGNGNSPYLACLTTAQISAAFGAQPAETLPTTWKQVTDTLPETKIVVFVPSLGDDLADVLLTDASGKVVPVRADAETNSDPLYRAAAVANVEGGLTYMNWSDYQKVLDNHQERIQLVSIDAGNGCTAPELTTITNGTYPLTRTLKLIVPQSQLKEAPVQSLLWLMFSDENFSLLENQGLTGISLDDLTDLRSTLQTAFDTAAAAASTASSLTAPVVTDNTATEEANATEDANATPEVNVTAETAATDEVNSTEESAPTATPAS